MSTQDEAVIFTKDGLLAHWQGHRALTRRVIEAYPEDQLFTFSVGGMRTFGELAQEMHGMAVPMLYGSITDDWSQYERSTASTKAELLAAWDESTRRLNELWPQLPMEKFQQTMTAFGQYTDRLVNLLFYVIDNEIHHRAQGYVYLRALGFEPPGFWIRD